MNGTADGARSVEDNPFYGVEKPVISVEEAIQGITAYLAGIRSFT